MPSFERLAIEEARTLTREELLPRIEEEQRYWYHRIHRCLMRPGDDAAFRTFNDIMHIAVDPRRCAAGEAVADENYWRRPLGELGEL
jgi:hypothetical protein